MQRRSGSRPSIEKIFAATTNFGYVRNRSLTGRFRTVTLSKFGEFAIVIAQIRHQRGVEEFFPHNPLTLRSAGLILRVYISGAKALPEMDWPTLSDAKNPLKDSDYRLNVDQFLAAPSLLNQHVRQATARDSLL